MNIKASGSAVSRTVVDGSTIFEIEDATAWDPDDICEVAEDEGYVYDAATSRFRAAPEGFQPTPRPAPVATVRVGDIVPIGPATVATAGTTPGFPPSQRDLIAEGLASDLARVRRAATKAKAALDDLAARLAETSEQAAARAKVAELEEQLRAAKAALRTGGSPTPAPRQPRKRPSLGVDLRAMKAWCVENDVAYPAAGRPTNALIAQYKAATQGGAA